MDQNTFNATYVGGVITSKLAAGNDIGRRRRRKNVYRREIDRIDDSTVI